MNNKEKIRTICLTGAIAAVIVILLTLFDIVAGTLTGGDLTTIPLTSIDKFIQLQEYRLSGLYNLDFLNLIVSVIFIPVFVALYISLRNDNEPSALLSLIVFTIGTSVFITNNAALPMLDLSQKYHAATTPDQSAFIASAGEALLAKGTHGSMGVFPGFVLITVSQLLISIVMYRGVIFSKATALFGISGTFLLIIYLILVTFSPSSKEMAMILAAPGGILSLIWMTLFSLRLFKLAAKD